MTMLSRRSMLKLAVSSVSLLSASRNSYCVPALNEEGFVSIGGIDQWIAVQGNDASNPVIRFLHGGPAEAQSPFLKEFLPWEQAFTVINWDQRGSGKTYGKNGASTPGMTTERWTREKVKRKRMRRRLNYSVRQPTSQWMI